MVGENLPTPMPDWPDSAAGDSFPRTRSNRAARRTPRGPLPDRSLGTASRPTGRSPIRPRPDRRSSSRRPGSRASARWFPARTIEPGAELAHDLAVAERDADRFFEREVPHLVVVGVLERERSLGAIHFVERRLVDVRDIRSRWRRRCSARDRRLPCNRTAAAVGSPSPGQTR